jgi:hypothetical protein
VVIKIETHEDIDQDGTTTDTTCFKPSKSRKFRNMNEGSSSSFKGLSNVNSFGKMSGRSSGMITSENECIDDKPQ